MFNDRDLGILGAGALLAVLCLFLPFSFVGRIVVGFLVLVLFMVLALMRLGPDRVPPEVWLQRRVRYGLDVRQNVNQQKPSSAPAAQKNEKQEPRRTVTPTPAVQFRPLDLAWGEVGIYPLLTAFLAVIAIYFSFWLARGGADQLAVWFKVGGVFWKP
jgi:hypothetical protein